MNDNIVYLDNNEKLQAKYSIFLEMEAILEKAFFERKKEMNRFKSMEFFSFYVKTKSTISRQELTQCLKKYEIIKYVFKKIGVGTKIYILSNRDNIKIDMVYTFSSEQLRMDEETNKDKLHLLDMIKKSLGINLGINTDKKLARVFPNSTEK